MLIYAYYKWFACKSSRRFSVKINSRTDKIWYNKINLREKEILYVFRLWNQSGKEGTGIREDRYLRSVRRIWEISGFYDLLLFQPLFIPIIKWNRHYYVQMSCCSTIYELDQEVGRRLAHGEQPDITEKDLTLVQAGRRVSGWNRKRCENCGYETEEDFEYCPKCGTKL